MIAELKRRCSERELPCRVRNLPESATVEIDFPAGPVRRTLRFGTRRLTDLVEVPFETYTLLGEFQAVSSYEDGWIEALIRTAMPFGFLGNLRQRFADTKGPTPAPLISLAQDGIEVTVDEASQGLAALFLRPIGSGTPSALSLRIRGLQIDRHDFALKTLEDVSNSLFLQIDTQMNVPLVLRRDQRQPERLRHRHPPSRELSFPDNEYDRKAMALYWYARSAMGMPLLQFLAFYQVLEFYFPIYADEEVRHRVKQVVRNPGFRPHREDEITRILNAITGQGRRGFGDERSQLRATIRRAVDAEAIRDFLGDLGGDGEYFEEPRKTVSASWTPIRAAMENDDLLDATANRIYEIRCRIVHTKDSDPDRGQLLPFSPEADRMGLDIALVQKLALGALVAGSRELTV